MTDVFTPHKEYTNLLTTPEMLFINYCHGVSYYYNGTKGIDFYGNITVLIPCYNKSNFIKNTVLSCVNQTKKVSTIVLLMDEKSIAMKDELESLGDVKCIIHDRLNVCAARTFLVDICPTDWFIFLDADDVLSEDFAEVLSKKDGAIRFSKITYDDSGPYDDGKPVFKKYESDSIINILCGNNTCLMHKNVFYDIKYDEELCNGGEDSDFIFRLINQHKWKINYVVDTKFYYQKTTENQLTKDYTNFCKSLEKCIVKNRHTIIEAIHNNDEIFDYKPMLLYVLENYSHELMLSFVDYMKDKTLLNIRFNIIVNNFFEKNINKNKGYSFPVLLNYGRILYFEDLILYMNNLKKYSPLELFEYLSKNDISVTGVNDRKKIIRNDDEFFSEIKDMRFPEEIQKYINIWRLRKYFTRCK